jgi:rRNA small subunit methyltransferase G
VRFLREAIRSLKLGNVRALQSQIETVEERFECVTARAFASLADMLGWGGHLLAPGSVWLAMNGKHPAEELDGVPADFRVEAIHARRYWAWTASATWWSSDGIEPRSRQSRSRRHAGIGAARKEAPRVNRKTYGAQSKVILLIFGFLES